MYCNYGLSVVTPPAVEPISKDTLKLSLRLDTGTVEDSLLDLYIQSGREQAEKDLRRAIIHQTLRLTLDYFPRGYWGTSKRNYIELLQSPVSSITSVTYKDPEGNWQTLSNTLYSLDNSKVTNRLILNYGETWPSTNLEANAVKIDYVAGYDATGTLCPATIKQAVILAASIQYYDREGIAGKQREDNAKAYERLISHYRINGV